MYRSIKSLVIINAVNTDVIIPKPKVTEKPFIGPEPKKKELQQLSSWLHLHQQ